MQFEGLALLKLAVVAGLAYLSYRKTCRIKQLQQRVFVGEGECIIKELGRAKEPIIQENAIKQERKDSKRSAYQQFVSAYKDIPLLQEMEDQEEDYEQQSPYLESLDLEKLQAGSTIAPDTKRETSSVQSQFINQCEESFFDERPQKYEHNTRQMLRDLRRKKLKTMHQRTVKRQKTKISKKFGWSRLVERRWAQ